MTQKHYTDGQRNTGKVIRSKKYLGNCKFIFHWSQSCILTFHSNRKCAIVLSIFAKVFMLIYIIYVFFLEIMNSVAMDIKLQGLPQRMILFHQNLEISQGKFSCGSLENIF